MNLSYTFHDAIVLSYEQETINRFSLIVQLNKVYYPSEETVKLTFSGVFNEISMHRFISKLQECTEDSSNNILGLRVDSIQYDSKKISKTDDLYFFINIDWIDPVKIHCKKFHITRVKKMDFDDLIKQKESFWQTYETFCVAGCCGIDAFDFSITNTKIAIREFNKEHILNYLNDLIKITYLSDEQFISSHFFCERMEKEKYIRIFKNITKMINDIK